MRLWAIAFLSGILIVQQLSSLPTLYWCLASLLVFVVFIPSRVIWSNNWLLLLISGLAFGFSWALGHAHWMMSQRLMPQYEGVDLVIEGQIISLPVSPSKVSNTKQYHFGHQRIRFDFKPSKVSHAKPISLNSADTTSPHIALAKFPQRIRLSWYRPTSTVQAGQFWRFTVRLKRPYGLLNPGGFDYASWLYQQRIQAKGSIRNTINNQILKMNTSSSILLDFTLDLRQTILNKLSAELDIGEHSSFILHATQSLILGYRGGLDAAQWRTFQRTGTIHLMAISGLHIGLVAALVYGLVGFLWRRLGRGCLVLPAPQIAAIAALLAATLYALLAGFTIPTQRALVMLSVAMLHIIFKRSPLLASKTIGLALVLVLLFDPLAVLAQGFWLSFLAVSLIIYLIQLGRNVNMISDDLDKYGIERIGVEKSAIHKAIQKAWISILKFGRIQWALTIAMFPLVLFFYQSSSLVSPFANFVAIPAISLCVVPLMFLATFFLFINTTIANFIFKLVDYVYSLLWQFLELLSGWQYATVELSIASLWALLSCYIAIILWLCVKGTPMRWLAMVLVLPILFYSFTSIKEGEAIVTVLDVGQGLSAVVQTKDHTLVFDTGPKYSENFDTGRAVVVPYLRQIGRSSIDTFIISHGDNDHIGGFSSIASMLPIKRVLSSVPDSIPQSISKNFTSGSEYEIMACHVGQNWQYDGVEFAILSPIGVTDAENGHDENNQSCVLKVTTQFGRVLISGDIERETESYLYHAMPKKLAAEILVVPHHGSNTSSLAGFIKAVAPRYAIFTVGYKNRYHLPNQKVIRRYQDLGQVQLLKSNETGALIFKLQQDLALQPLSYRKQVKRYWHTSAVTAF